MIRLVKYSRALLLKRNPPALLVKYTVGLAKYPFCWKMDVLRKKSLKIRNKSRPYDGPTVVSLRSAARRLLAGQPTGTSREESCQPDQGCFWAEPFFLEEKICRPTSVNHLRASAPGTVLAPRGLTDISVAWMVPSFRIHGCHRHGSRFMSKEKSKYIDVINVNTDIYIEVVIKI